MVENLDELREKLDKLREERSVDPSPEEWKRVAPIMARGAMRGAIGAVLKLDEEAKNMVLREAGAAACRALLETEGKKWEPDGLSQIARAVMSGAFKGILKLDEEAKRLVFKGMGEGCFQRFLKTFKHWEAAGIPLTEGSYDIDSAIVLLEKQLSARKVWRDKDTIFWEADVAKWWGRCSCCLIWAGITEPVPEVCQCATWHMKKHFEYYTGIPMEAQLVETLNTGNQEKCIFRIHLKPTQYTAREVKTQ